MVVSKATVKVACVDLGKMKPVAIPEELKRHFKVNNFSEYAMTAELNFLDLFLKASIVVQLVIVILISFSIISWAIIIQRSRILTSALKEANTFEDRFWSGEDLNKLFMMVYLIVEVLTGSEQIFFVGFKEFSRLKQVNANAQRQLSKVRLVR